MIMIMMQKLPFLLLHAMDTFLWHVVVVVLTFLWHVVVVVLLIMMMHLHCSSSRGTFWSIAWPFSAALLFSSFVFFLVTFITIFRGEQEEEWGSGSTCSLFQQFICMDSQPYCNQLPKTWLPWPILHSWDALVQKCLEVPVWQSLHNTMLSMDYAIPCTDEH